MAPRKRTKENEELWGRKESKKKAKGGQGQSPEKGPRAGGQATSHTGVWGNTSENKVVGSGA